MIPHGYDPLDGFRWYEVVMLIVLFVLLIVACGLEWLPGAAG